MIWFLGLLAAAFLAGITVLFVLDRIDQPSSGIGTLSPAPGTPFRPMVIAGGSFSPDDF